MELRASVSVFVCTSVPFGHQAEQAILRIYQHFKIIIICPKFCSKRLLTLL